MEFSCVLRIDCVACPIEIVSVRCVRYIHTRGFTSYVSRCISHTQTYGNWTEIKCTPAHLRSARLPQIAHLGRDRRALSSAVIERVHGRAPAAQRASVAAVHKTQRSPAACVLLVTQSCSWPWACPSRAAAAGWTRRRGGSSRHRRSRTPTTRRATSCTRGPAA